MGPRYRTIQLNLAPIGLDCCRRCGAPLVIDLQVRTDGIAGIRMRAAGFFLRIAMKLAGLGFRDRKREN